MIKDRLTVLAAMMEQGVIPVFYDPDVEVCKNVIQACANGGAKCIEFDVQRGEELLAEQREDQQDGARDQAGLERHRPLLRRTRSGAGALREGPNPL